MNSPDEARIAAAIEKASEAFWATFASEFPEVKTGDVDPLTSVSFDESVERAAREWVSVNWPDRATV